MRGNVTMFYTSAAVPSVFYTVRGLRVRVDVRGDGLLGHPVRPCILSCGAVALSLPLSFGSSVFFFYGFSGTNFYVVFPLNGSVLAYPFVNGVLSTSWVSLSIIGQDVTPNDPVCPRNPAKSNVS